MSANNMVKLTIDGQGAHTVPKGTRVMPAADSIGIHIPRFCYHGSLSVLGTTAYALVKHSTPLSIARQASR